MSCLLGRQSPGLHHDLENDIRSESKAFPQDSEDQGLNGLSSDRDLRPAPVQTLATLERLAQATGGTEKSWYRCVFPLAVISLVIGTAGTGVTFSFDTLLRTKAVAVLLLCGGAAMMLAAALCRRTHRLRKRKEAEFFITDQETL